MAVPGPRPRRRLNGAWYVLPGVLLLAALVCGGGVAATALLEKGRNTLSDMTDSKDSSARADLTAGSRYRVKVTGQRPDAAVACAFDDGAGGVFRLRFPPMSTGRGQIAATIGVFTAPRGGVFEVSCFESGAAASRSFDNGRVYGVRVDSDYVTGMRDWGIGAGAAAALAVASFVVVLVLRRRT
jgi:hypothetical protein